MEEGDEMMDFMSAIIQQNIDKVQGLFKDIWS